jgi:hypothetical protein
VAPRTPEGAFKVLVDYPWDEPGHTVDEDRLRATNVRKKQGHLHTVCWLPRHMSPTELGVLTELAAVRYLLSDAGQEDLLETLSAQDRSKILDQAGIRQKTLEGQLDDLLKEVYVRHGEFFALISDVDSSRPRETLVENLEHIATLLMDRRYPQHPTFLAEPKKQDLEVLLDWMVQAGETNVSVAYDESVGKVLKSLGQPLELVNLGQTKASLRLDSRYIKDVFPPIHVKSNAARRARIAIIRRVENYPDWRGAPVQLRCYGAAQPAAPARAAARNPIVQSPVFVYRVSSVLLTLMSCFALRARAGHPLV